MQTTDTRVVHQVVSSLSDGLLRQLWEDAGSNGEMPRIVGKVESLPKIGFLEEYGGQSQQVSATLVLLFLPLVSMMFFPFIVASVQLECVEKNVMAMQIQSMRLPNYWIATYLWHFSIYLINVAVFYALNLVVGTTSIVNADHTFFIVVLVLWGHAQISMATLLATALGKSRLTTLLAYLLVILTLVAGPLFLAISSAQSDGLPSPGRRWPRGVFLFPPVSFVRGMLLVLLVGKGDMVGGERAELQEIWIFQFIMGCVFFGIGVMLHMLRQGTTSFSGLLSFARCSDEKDECRDCEQGMDEEDVAAEARRVAQGRQAGTLKDAVVVHDLVKKYSSGFLAVQGVSFGIPTGECFGLLGPNGAGKTTIISMLSGSETMTAGTAVVGGFDVQTQMQSIRQILGICPQFDIVWRDLTVIEHLILFARIKGIAKCQQRAQAREVAERVGLDGDPLRMAASKLSGGQRRRLSLGIALVTDPRVIFLDEPSTGLDPETRQGLWRIISELTDGRCVVLTTHSMEEADALCGRIGIMACGSLRCLGTPMHLKGKFGQGYRLTVSMVPARCNDASFAALDNFVKEHFSKEATAVPTWERGSVRTYNLPKKEVKVSRVFELITEQAKKDLFIQDWSLNQTSLNEVFLRIAKESER